MEYTKHRNRKVEAYWSASRPKLIGKPKLRPAPMSNPRPPKVPTVPTPPAASPQSYEALPKNLRVLASRMDTLEKIRGAHLIAKELDKASATLNTGVRVQRSPEEVAAARAERKKVFLSRPGFIQPAPVRPQHRPEYRPGNHRRVWCSERGRVWSARGHAYQRPGFLRPDARTPAAIRARSPSPAPRASFT
jgi:hypothetical protein